MMQGFKNKARGSYYVVVLAPPMMQRFCLLKAGCHRREEPYLCGRKEMNIECIVYDTPAGCIFEHIAGPTLAKHQGDQSRLLPGKQSNWWQKAVFWRKMGCWTFGEGALTPSKKSLVEGSPYFKKINAIKWQHTSETASLLLRGPWNNCDCWWHLSMQQN